MVKYRVILIDMETGQETVWVTVDDKRTAQRWAREVDRDFNRYETVYQVIVEEWE